MVVLEEDKHAFLIEILHFRRGRMIGSRFYFFENEVPGEERLLSLLNQYYAENLIPDELLISISLDLKGKKILEQVLTKRYKKPCRIKTRVSKEEKNLVFLAQKNAQLHFKQEISKEEDKKHVLQIIKNKFHLKELPVRMECYDISHWQGQEIIGSQVVFEEGKPSKKEYRLYKLKKQDQIDDYQALKEVLKRRFQKKEMKRPSLILIDGGKGQLAACLKALKDLKIKDIPLVALAKSRVKKEDSLSKKPTHSKERFFLPGRKNPCEFPSSSKAGNLLLFLRDEAHRFAIKTHRKNLEKKTLTGDLDGIKGLGEKTKKKLLKEFQSLEGLKKASLKDLEQHVSKSLAKKLYDFLSQT